MYDLEKMKKELADWENTPERKAAREGDKSWTSLKNADLLAAIEPFARSILAILRLESNPHVRLTIENSGFLLTEDVAFVPAEDCNDNHD